ncbi:MAG TPA: hypothetical protein VN181_09955 [Thermoanaerobaculia bacterium]|nr:hypothetical protein [Thermoanaerobaculia bacterium]
MNLNRWTAFLIAVLIPIAATAQQGLRDRDPNLGATKKIAADLQKANFHTGPFYLLSSIQLSDIGFNEEFFVPTDTHSGGLTLSLEAPQRFYFVPRKKTVYSIDFVPSVAFIEGDERTHQFGYSLRGDAQYLLNHLYLDFYAIAGDQLRSFVGEINRVATQKEGEVGVSGEFKYSSKTSSLFSVRHRVTEYPDDRFQPVDIPINLLARSENNFRLALHHRTFPRTSLRVASELSVYNFKRATYKDSRREYVGLGALFDNGETVINIEAGPGRLVFNDRTQPDFTGVLGTFGMSRRIGSRWTVGLNGGRDVDFAILLDNNYRLSTRAVVSLDFAATRRLTLHGSSANERDEYDTPLHGIQRRDDIRFDLVGFTYGWRHVNAGLDVGYYTRESNYLADDQNGIRYIVHLSFTP